MTTAAILNFLVANAPQQVSGRICANLGSCIDMGRILLLCPTWTTARTSGREFWVGGTGGRRQKRWWAGASDSSCRSLGEFWRGRKMQVSKNKRTQMTTCDFQLQNEMWPYSATPRREPSASAETPRTPCDSRTACLCLHNTWTAFAKEKRWKHFTKLSKEHMKTYKGLNYDFFCFGRCFSSLTVWIHRPAGFRRFTAVATHPIKVVIIY